MKRILFALVVAFTFAGLVLAQQKTTSLVKDSIDKVKVTITKSNPTSKGGAVTVSSADDDSVFVAEFIDIPDDSSYVSSNDEDIDYHNNNGISLLNKIGGSFAGEAAIIVFITLALTFGFPLFIIFLAFYFRYKNRKAHYKLVEQVIAAGQPIPEGLFKQNLDSNNASKGIKNICLGIGLFIFLWAITGSFAIGTIGLLIMFTGIGQWLIARNQHPNEPRQ